MGVGGRRWASVGGGAAVGGGDAPSVTHLEEGGGDGEEDALDLGGWLVGEGDHVHVAQHSVGDRLAAAARRAHRSEERDVDDALDAERLAVVPAAVVHHLPHQLDGRLRAVSARGRAEDVWACGRSLERVYHANLGEW